MNPFRSGVTLAVLAGAVVVLGVASGCASSGRRSGRGPAAEPVPVKRGEAGFFAGEVLAVVDLGPVPRPAPPGGSGAAGGEGAGREGGGPPAGSARRGPPPGGGPGGGEGPRGMAAGGGGRGGVPGGGAGSLNFPPAWIVLTLTNATDATADVAVAAFNSRLGNFAVQPERIALAPRTSTAAEPMTSRMGVGPGEIPVTVILLRNGTRETQVIVLRDVPAPSAPSP